jgi:hypothetical protein
MGGGRPGHRGRPVKANDPMSETGQIASHPALSASDVERQTPRRWYKR